ncbi:hypothetical protein V499_03432 [Pseudogymnoascus sp. VKM F-103]|uniref:Alpha-L-rhamnosidase six-hairpin glycosidase domain-containing protein n=1 Tax=Pseudogymnoascus verrucosus TaxID=342668 RepID=A0A1B8G8A2_9PEZI|nr:uncharacterized protein VE01_09770 [Pseudogymnoascus verrucosus]KFY77108.1 hypothetical protein V499_03432 [Pseudogymnoascus sp. VKM F-103]OBT92058.1 hypothetical protein VE01_09770 [Pseudogymnoascus verrucosus]
MASSPALARPEDGNTIYKYKLPSFINSMIFRFALSLAFVAGAVVTAGVVSTQALLKEQQDSLLVQELPAQAVFPGPWDRYIQAPANKAHIRPKAIHLSNGDVVNPSAVLEGGLGSSTLGAGGNVIFDFAQNIGGRVCFQVASVVNNTFLALTYSESPTYATVDGDATNNNKPTDLPLYFGLRNGTNCVGTGFIRGGFRFLSIRLPLDPKEDKGFWDTSSRESVTDASKRDPGATVSLTELWVNCTAFPSNPNPRAYTGYFSSSSNVLNRVWYAGAYTLQLSTIVPTQGGASIDYNAIVDGNKSPVDSWYSNFTISNGTSVTTDGAKRDRMVWPGDMSIAVPGIAVSTRDMVSVRNALDTLFAHQYGDGSLPYAGPPMGTIHEFSDTYHMHSLLGVYNYVLYSGDLGWLEDHWYNYTVALNVSIAKVDNSGLMHVTSTADWLRSGMSGHNIEATAILYDVLQKSIELAGFLGDDRSEAQPGGLWSKTGDRIRAGVEKLDCPRAGLFADNSEDRRCGGSDEVLPQDGNSWLLLAGVLAPSDPRRLNVSKSLKSRWTKFGPPAVEAPNIISPFASSFELQAHCAVGDHDTAVELMELMWGYMLDGPGMTNSTLLEGYRIDGSVGYPAYTHPARNSHCHGWSTGPTMVLLTSILGIQFTAPLGRSSIIRPHRTKWLNHVEGGYSTSLGKFAVKLKGMIGKGAREAEVLQVLTPTDTSGTVYWGGNQTVHNGGVLKVARYLDSPGQWITLLNTTDYGDEKDDTTWATDSEGDGEFLPDTAWVKPSSSEREVGVVNWSLIKPIVVEEL